MPPNKKPVKHRNPLITDNQWTRELKAKGRLPQVTHRHKLEEILLKYTALLDDYYRISGKTFPKTSLEYAAAILMETKLLVLEEKSLDAANRNIGFIQASLVFNGKVDLDWDMADNKKVIGQYILGVLP